MCNINNKSNLIILKEFIVNTKKIWDLYIFDYIDYSIFMKNNKFLIKNITLDELYIIKLCLIFLTYRVVNSSSKFSRVSKTIKDFILIIK